MSNVKLMIIGKLLRFPQSYPSKYVIVIPLARCQVSNVNYENYEKLLPNSQSYPSKNLVELFFTEQIIVIVKPFARRIKCQMSMENDSPFLSHTQVWILYEFFSTEHVQFVHQNTYTQKLPIFTVCPPNVHGTTKMFANRVHKMEYFPTVP